MTKLFSRAVPVAAVSIALLFAQADPLPIGSELPRADVKMKDISGKDVSFKDAMGKKGLLVMFSCNTCPVVKRYQSRINEVSKYALGKDIGVILLNPNEAYRDNGDSYDDMKDYAKKNGFSWYYVMDDHSAMADAFGANRTPELFLFNGEGKLVYHGAIDDNSSSADEVTRKHAIVAIDELTAGKDISVKQTRSVGCTIKRKS
ncbi:MAG TPA: thioredoxin family protein [Chitinophagaceae bacterium]|nr:thioredoxin family protein [Chitinophagaceae bacterium]